MKKAIAAAFVICVAAILFYMSRFWPFEFWTRQSWIAQMGLRPQGGLLQVWLRGTPFSQFELIVWAVGSFAILSLTEKLLQRLGISS